MIHEAGYLHRICKLLLAKSRRVFITSYVTNVQIISCCHIVQQQYEKDHNKREEAMKASIMFVGTKDLQILCLAFQVKVVNVIV